MLPSEHNWKDRYPLTVALNWAVCPVIFIAMSDPDSVMSPATAPPAPVNVMIGPLLVAKVSAAIAMQNEPDRSFEMEALLTITGVALVFGVYATSLVWHRLDTASVSDEFLIYLSTKSKPHVKLHNQSSVNNHFLF